MFTILNLGRGFISAACQAVFLGFLVVSIGGCTAADNDFALNGAGADLMSQQTVAATNGIDAYLGEICRQADLQTSGARPFRCQTAGFDEYAWHSVVKAGMNDIDHRCDLYLSWLDSKRSEKQLVDATFVNVTATTAGVLGLAAPGSNAIHYVALALGLASQTYNAFYTRALLGIEPSTIKLTVEGRRLAFRDAYLNAKYREKSDVVYVLRSYLRICTPQTITMDVNTFARAAVTGEEPPQFANLQLERQALESVRPVTSPALIVQRKPPAVSKAVLDTFPGNHYNDQHLKLLRSNLCVRSSDPDNSKTMAAIKLWENNVYGSEPNDKKDGRVNDAEWTGAGTLRGIRDLGTCQSKFSNIDERFALEDTAREKTFIRALKKVGLLTDGDSLDQPSVRTAITKANVSCFPAASGDAGSAVTDALYNKVLEWAAMREGSSCGQVQAR